MKQMWNSFLRTVFRFVKTLFRTASERARRGAVVLTAGIAVMTVVTFAANDSFGSTRDVLAALAYVRAASDAAETELEQTKEETLTGTEAATEKKRGIGPGFEEQNRETEKPENTEIQNTQESGGTEKNGEERPESAVSGAETEPETEPETKPASAGAISYTANDYRVLQRIVQAEAGDCDMKGRILVANVVMNRVRSSQFPNTITGVVYERQQFSPVGNGTINTCRVTEKTVEAVDRALAGEDYSQGALYFMNRRTAAKKNVRWFDSHLSYLFEHDGHEFFR